MSGKQILFRTNEHPIYATMFSSIYAIIIIYSYVNIELIHLFVRIYSFYNKERDGKNPPAKRGVKFEVLERLRSRIHISWPAYPFQRERERESQASTAPLKLGHLYFKSLRACMDRLSSLNASRVHHRVSLYKEKSSVRVRRKKSFVRPSRGERKRIARVRRNFYVYRFVSGRLLRGV